LASIDGTWTSEVAVGDSARQPVMAPVPVEVSARLQTGAVVGIFALLVFYFLYFVSPINLKDLTEGTARQFKACRARPRPAR